MHFIQNEQQNDMIKEFFRIKKEHLIFISTILMQFHKFCKQSFLDYH